MNVDGSQWHKTLHLSVRYYQFHKSRFMDEEMSHETVGKTNENNFLWRWDCLMTSCKRKVITLKTQDLIIDDTNDDLFGLFWFRAGLKNRMVVHSQHYHLICSRENFTSLRKIKTESRFALWNTFEEVWLLRENHDFKNFKWTELLVQVRKLFC